MTKLIERGMRWGFGALWIYSGALKLADPMTFLDAVRSFQLLGDPWAAVVALSLPPLEIICGAAIILGRWGTGAALVIMDGALVVFTAAIVYSWQRGLDITCGCFGRSENLTDYPRKLTENVALLCIGGILLTLWIRRQRGKAAPAAAGA